MTKKRLAGLFLAAFLLMASVPIVTAAAEDTFPRAAVSVGEQAQEYSSVKKALDAALKQSGATVTLLADWNISTDGVAAKGFVVPEGKTLSLDLNGHVIRSANRYGRVFYVSKKACLEIADSAPDAATYSTAIHGGVLAGCTSEAEGGAIYAAEQATLKMTGGSFAACMSEEDGGAVYAAENVVVSLENVGFFTCRSSDGDGGALYSDDGTVTLENCKFEGSGSACSGGALYLNSDKQTLLCDCSFSYNRAEDHGGAVYVNGSGGVSFKDNTLSQNTAAKNGGAVYVNADRVTLFSNRITENTASGKGGGVYVDSMYDINCCEQLVIEKNTDKNGSSDLCLQSGLVTTAYMNCGGFTEGARVGVDIAEDDEAVICREISVFQYKNYLFADHGKLSFTKQKVVAENFVSSAIGEGSVKAIIAGAAVLVLCSVCIPLSMKKRKGGTNNETA